MPLGLEIAGEIRPLTETEAAEPATNQVAQLTHLRDSHHAAARLLAMGERDMRVCQMTGYAPARLAGLKRDPLFQELIAHYRHAEDEGWTEFTSRAEQVARDLLQSIHDDVLDQPYIPLDKKVKAFEVIADRAGFAPIQRSINKNLNVSIAERMDAARRKKDAA